MLRRVRTTVQEATVGGIGVEMRAALVEIENAAKANDPARLRKMIARLAAVWANTQPMLRADRRDTPRDVAGR